MIIQDKTVIQALRLWNKFRPAWTRVKTFGQLTEQERAKVLDMALDLHLLEKRDFTEEICQTK